MLCIAVLALTLACSDHPSNPDAARQEIIKAEKAFAEMAAEKGVPAAFLEYAAADAVLLRGKRLIKGKENIRQYFDGQTLQNVKLDWEPEFVDVAASGDMAYTFGPYTFSAADTSGNEISDTGYFHTVWKKQADGKWKFVWD